jgi:hypothetical protein
VTDERKNIYMAVSKVFVRAGGGTIMGLAAHMACELEHMLSLLWELGEHIIKRFSPVYVSCVWGGHIPLLARAARSALSQGGGN